MGCGSSKTAPLHYLPGNRLKVNDWDSLAESFDEMDFYSRLNEGADLGGFRTFSVYCGCGYLFNVWDLILDCESTFANENPVRALGLYLRDYERGFPVLPELLKCLDMEKYERQLIMPLLCVIKLQCSSLIFTNIFKPSKSSLLYEEICSNMTSTEITNKTAIDIHSFNYYSVINKSEFGLVLQVQLKSTGSMYAMKLQPKMSILKNYSKDLSRITSEFAANVVLDHAYLAGIAYAFHTTMLTMLVYPVSTCGDLWSSLQHCPNHQMSLDRVVFYAAEITSALAYLHRHDIMYLDLKLSSILMYNDGHIKLTDFGSFADIGDSFRSYYCGQASRELQVLTPT